MHDPEDASRAVEAQVGSRDVWILAAIMVVAFLLRAVDIHNQSFTMDEMAELGIAATGIRDIIHFADGFPPSYHFALKSWLGVFGTDAAARWLSVLIGVSTVPVIWSIGRDVGGRGVAIWSAALLSLAPLHNWFSREARAYALYVLVASLAMWLLFRALDRNQKTDWSAFSLVATLGVYIHYFFPVLLAVGLLLVVLERGRLDSLKPAVLAYVAIGVASLPVLYVLQADFAFQAADTRQTPFDVGALVYTYMSMVTGFTIGPSLRELHTMGLREAAAGMLVWAPFLAAGVGLLVLDGSRSLKGSRWRVRLLLFSLAPVVLAGALAALGGIGFRVRYVSYVVIPIFVWLAAGTYGGRNRWSTRLATLTLLLIFTVSLVNRRTNDRYAEEDARSLAEFLVTGPAETKPVLVSSHYMADPVGYYMPETWQVIAVPRVDEQGGGLDDAMNAIESGGGTDDEFWFVYSREFDGDPASHLLVSLEQAWTMRLEAEFAGIRLYRVGPIP